MKFDDISDLDSEETTHAFMSFCTFASLTQGKKLNTANIFLLLLKNKALRKVFKQRIDADTDYEALSMFLKFDPTLHKSKYIMKYLNKVGVEKIKQ